MKFNRKITRDLFEPRTDLGDRRMVVDREAGTISARVYSFGESYSTNHRIKGPRNVNVEAAHIGNGDDVEPGLKLGNLAMHIMHAGDTLTAAQAAEWYNNTENAVARGRYSADDKGVRFDGVLFDDIGEAKLDRLTAAAPSGDWRWKANSMVRKPEDMEHQPCDFVGSCMVNVPGFSDTYQQSPMTPLRLVASAESDETLLTDIEESIVAETEVIAEDAPKCGDGVCCGGACKDEAPAEDAPAEDAPAEEQAADEVEAPDHDTLTAAATLLAQHASVLGLDEDTAQALTAAASGPAPTSGDTIESLRADLDALAQIVYDAILAM